MSLRGFCSICQPKDLAFQKHTVSAREPILIDTDRGYDRAVQRVDTLCATKWADVTAEAEAIKRYKTVVLDTAKAALDDYLAVYVCEQNYKLRTNGLKRFGAMADEFKQFINMLRSNGQDLVIICHDKETQEGDVIKHAPDCTGQSKDLLIRIADQVGFVSIRNKQRVVSFEPDDTHVGKNVARMADVVVPDVTDEAFGTFMADILDGVRDAIQSRTEAQRCANELLARLHMEMPLVTDEEGAAALMEMAKGLPQVMKAAFFAQAKAVLAGAGLTYDVKSKSFRKDGTPA